MHTGLFPFSVCAPRVSAYFVAACIAVLMCCSPSASGAPASELQLPQVWKANLSTFLESTATVADLKGDGRLAALCLGRDEIIAVDGKGKELWRYRSKGRFMTYPAVLTRKGQSSLIFAADSAGQLDCVDGAGAEVWHAQLKGPVAWSGAVVAELNADGAAQVIQGDSTGALSAFDALTGKPVWQAALKGIPASSAIGDIDGDGKQEVLVTTNAGLLSALKSDGTALWARTIGGASADWATSSPVIFGASDGSVRIVAATNDGQVYCLDGQGQLLWQQPTRGPVASTISVGDLDQDGRVDIFVVTQLGVIFRFDESGRTLWDIDMQGRSLASGAIADINGDKQLEYVLCTQTGRLMVLNTKGEFIYDYQFENRTINVTPAVGDMAPDSPGLDLVITGGEAGLLYGLGTSSGKDAVVQWPLYRCDVRNSGAWFGLTQTEALQMAPQNLAWDRLLTGENVRFVIHNPKPGEKPLKATAVCIRPDGARQVANSNVLGASGELLLAVDAVVPGTYRFTWSLADADGRELFTGAKDVALEPFANDRALAGRAVASLTSAADTVEAALPLSAAALRREARLLDSDSKALAPKQDAMPGANSPARQEALDKTAALVTRSARLLRVSDAVRQAAALGKGTSLVAFEGNVWENRNADNQVPARAISPLKIARRAVPGEHEPIALSLFNVTDHALQVRAVLDAPAGGPVVTLLRTTPVPTSLGEVAWDAMPELDESNVIDIPSLSSRELWLDVNVGAAQPGSHRIAVKLQALNGAGVLDAPKNPHTEPAPETLVEATLQVLPFEMASYSAMRMCTWAAPEGPQVDDLLAHGNTAFTCPMGVAKFDAQGLLTGVDYAKLDPVLARFKGKDVVLMPNGLPNLSGDMKSEQYKKDLAVYLNDMVKHLADAGFDYDHFALYPIDEPGGAGWKAVQQVTDFSVAVKAIDPKILVYVDGGGEGPMFEEMAKGVDIWSPSIYQLPDGSEEMKVMRRTGKMMWSYNCGYTSSRPVGANLKNINIFAEYRTAALFAARWNATGIGFWCYNLGGDPWMRQDLEYPLVYAGRTRPVDSRRWEAVREGIEDTRIVAALRKRLEAKDGAPLSDDARARIKHLLEAGLPGLVDEGYKAVTQGAARNVIDQAYSETKMNAFRTELMNCVEALSPPTPAPAAK
ncbi:MAG: PQQ-binding-like beta-propeller repeat protein [Candidatus Hydrogenedentes bacterium]|nr:PQQ-binding-like beta-propeller repeat protein [Candidatus Hydrogenedentota bacterium]